MYPFVSHQVMGAHALITIGVESMSYPPGVTCLFVPRSTADPSRRHSLAELFLNGCNPMSQDCTEALFLQYIIQNVIPPGLHSFPLLIRFVRARRTRATRAPQRNDYTCRHLCRCFESITTTSTTCYSPLRFGNEARRA